MYDKFQCEKCKEMVDDDAIRAVAINKNLSLAHWCVDCYEYFSWACARCHECFSDEIEPNVVDKSIDLCLCDKCYKRYQGGELRYEHL